MPEWRRLGRRFAFLNAAFILAAALIYALSTYGVIGTEEPAYTGTDQQVYEQYFGYLADNEVMESGAAILASLGFLCLIPIGLTLKELFDRRPKAQLAAAAFASGATLLTTAQLIQVGARRAVVELSASHDLTSLDVVLDVIGPIINWLENGGYLLLGLATLGVGAAALGSGILAQGWARLSLVAGVAYILVVVAQGAELWDLYDPLLIFGGVILAPTWAIWLGVQLRDTGST